MDWSSFLLGAGTAIALAIFYMVVLDFFEKGNDIDWPYLSLFKKPCEDISVLRGKQCNVPTRRRWRDGRKFRPVCSDCNNNTI